MEHVESLTDYEKLKKAEKGRICKTVNRHSDWVRCADRCTFRKFL